MRLFTRCINLLVIALLITPSQALATSKAVRNIRNLDIIDSGVDGYILKTNGTTIEWQPQPDTKITGLIDNGDNVTLTGNGTLANPYVISSSGSGAGGDALTTDSLSQFAATTSAELAGVITDEVGSGSLVFNISPTINGASFLNTVTVNGTFLAKAHA